MAFKWTGKGSHKIKPFKGKLAPTTFSNVSVASFLLSHQGTYSITLLQWHTSCLAEWGQGTHIA